MKKKMIAKLKVAYAVIFHPFEEGAKDARISAELEKTGHIIGVINIFIASIVFTNNDSLVSRNISHFERIPQIKIQNWDI